MNDGSFIAQTLDLWVDGGVLMGPLALLAALIYACIFSVLFELSGRAFHKIDPNRWGHWVERPHEAEGELGDIIRYLDANAASNKQLAAAVDSVRQDYIPSLGARMRYATILVTAAPLAGLLGTVIGMLKTFDGISGAAGAGTTSLVAGGIAEALITTETGLVIAIPGMVLLHRARGLRDRLDLFLVQLENAFARRRLRAERHTA